MTVELLDTHCHLDVAAFDGDRDAVLARSRASGLRGIVVPGIAADGWPRLAALCAAHADLHPAYGLHPVFLASHGAADLGALEARLASGDAVAVGEIGLDHAVEGLDRGAQRLLLEAQLAIARNAGLPVLLHVRKAHDEVLDALRRIPVDGGIVHAFSGSLQQARRYIELGFHLGFGGMLTFERSTRLHALARELPIESLVLETDAPDLTVASHRGERNSPEYLPEVLDALARARDADRATVARQTTASARAVLRLEGLNGAVLPY